MVDVTSHTYNAGSGLLLQQLDLDVQPGTQPLRGPWPLVASPSRSGSRPPVADVDFLAQVPVLQGLTRAELAEVATCFMRRRYKKGEVICRQGDPASGLYVVEAGTVNHLATAMDGRELHVALNRRCEAFGLTSLIDGDAERTSSVALEHCQLLIIDRTEFCRLLQEYPRLALGILNVFTLWLRRNEASRLELACLPAPIRIARLIVDFAASNENRAFQLTQDEVALIVGITRETANRCLRALEREGLIRCGRGTIAVHDAAGLERAAFGTSNESENRACA